jgi:GAF domain-containing protein
VKEYHSEGYNWATHRHEVAKHPPRSPSEQDQKILEQVTHLAAVAIERKRNEAELRESEERFRLIVDTIPELL